MGFLCLDDNTTDRDDGHCNVLPKPVEKFSSRGPILGLATCHSKRWYDTGFLLLWRVSVGSSVAAASIFNKQSNFDTFLMVLRKVVLEVQQRE
mmetsp:Transcript_16338/g.39890  ORF Transcript_16338/g.39890 Transcript_16338/m.39890 type:complete len:93 (-) Transcript_16338:868-1146(-)